VVLVKAPARLLGRLAEGGSEARASRARYM